AVLLAVSAPASILYGALCAIPQNDLKRLLGYSSIVTAGYLLIGLASGSKAGIGASLYYMTAYTFAVLAVFTVVSIVFGAVEPAEIARFAGLYKRSPLLAVALTLAMISLAGIPPLAGFFGKFLLVKAAVGSAGFKAGLVVLIAVMVVGIVISIYYYFGVIRAVYWVAPSKDAQPITVTGLQRMAVIILIVGLIWLGLFPGWMIRASSGAVGSIATFRQPIAEVVKYAGESP
ncbi:MAG: NADH-quinone oxidoreductase subunit N, partial [Verrucomicrobiia bacterium]